MISDRCRYGHKESGRKTSVRLIGLEDFEKEVIKERMPVLVLCMHRDPDFLGQIKVIERITAKMYGKDLKVCLLEEESVAVFREKYRVGGTPTFLLFRGGKEMSRLLGQAEPGIFEDFLSRMRTGNTGSE